MVACFGSFNWGQLSKPIEFNNGFVNKVNNTRTNGTEERTFVIVVVAAAADVAAVAAAVAAAVVSVTSFNSGILLMVFQRLKHLPHSLSVQHKGPLHTPHLSTSLFHDIRVSVCLGF